eukprot:scaffold9391_cov52-Phaeocystis_antarctica.AAC.3
MCAAPTPAGNVRATREASASRTPARAVASRGKGRVAPPRATDQQLVGVGQGVCGLPGRMEGIRLSSETWTRRREGMGRQYSARAACTGKGPGCEGGGG